MVKNIKSMVKKGQKIIIVYIYLVLNDVGKGRLPRERETK